MEVPIDKSPTRVRVRVRDAHEDDVKATTIKERIKIKIKKLSTLYRYVYKPKSNLDLCNNSIAMLLLSQVMLDQRRS